MTETDIERAIIQALKAIGVVVAKTKAKAKRGRNGVTGLPTGWPDLTGYLRDGRALFIEVKAPKCEPTEEQTAFLERARRAGCVAGIARSPEDAIRLVMGG